MLRLMTTSILLVTVLLGVHPSFARYGKRNMAQQQKSIESTKGAWSKGLNTVIKLDDQVSNQSDHCSVFEVKLNRNLEYQFECQGKLVSQTIDLQDKTKVSITRHRGQITLTKFNYLSKKPQTSQLKQASLKIPYVEEIIYINKQKNGELSFYFEKFRLDEFGRIVQESIVQAHGLSKSGVRVSSY